MALRDLIRRSPRQAAVAPDTPPMLMRAGGVRRQQTTPQQEKARYYSTRLGFVRNSYRFLAHQAARCTIYAGFSTDNGLSWQRPDIEQGDPIPQAVAQLVKPPGRGQPDLIRTAVFLDETLGEYRLIQERDEISGAPGWTVRDWQALKRVGDQYEVRDVPAGTEAQGTMRLVPVTAVFRHWQPAEDWVGLPTSSLMGIVEDIDYYFDLQRGVRRKTRSRLGMDDAMWVPSEALFDQVQMDNGQVVSQFEKDWAEIVTMGVSDLAEDEIETLAPLLLKWPSTLNVKPEVIGFSKLDPAALPFLQDARRLVADSMPLSTQAILDGQADPNHWNKWAADDDDVQTIESSLRRTLDSLTEACFRPMLKALIAQGRWAGNPNDWRLDGDTDEIRKRVDNSENARFAAVNRLIKPEAVVEALHFDVNDLADAQAFAFYAQVNTVMPSAAKTPLGAPPESGLALGAGNVPPNDGVPPIAELTRTASLTLRDDRWLLDH